MIRIASIVPDGIPEGLVRDLVPLGRAVRATLPDLATRALQSRSSADAALRSLAAALRREWPDGRIRRVVASRGAAIVKHSDREWGKLRRPRRDALPEGVPDGRKLLANWSADAASMITSVRAGVAEGLQRDILHALENDWTPEQLAASWTKRGHIPVKFGTLEGRVKTIAHHQLRSLGAEIQRERAGAVGVRQFTWITQGDDRVRDEHDALGGRVFDYDDPPSEGLPGQPVNCRCYAESVITDDMLAELFS